jgi:hypothetical protein
MRGKRTFRKTITRMPSGRFAWNVLDTFGNRLDGGLAHSYRDARKKSRAAEAAIHIPQAKSLAVDPAYSMRNQNRDCFRR